MAEITLLKQFRKGKLAVKTTIAPAGIMPLGQCVL